MKATQTEIASIINTVELYRDGHYHFDVQKLKQAFHPDAHIVGYDEGGLIFASLDQYLEGMSGYKSSAEQGEPPDTKVISLDKTDTTAVVKIESLISGTRFVSLLSMLKTDSGWQIVNGLFHARPPTK